MKTLKRSLTEWNNRRLFNRRRRRVHRVRKAGVGEIEGNWFEGRSVAIIGPAENVELELQNHTQSEFDVIVRLNKGIEIALEDETLWGPRTDVLFHNLKEDNTERSSGRLEDNLFVRSGLRYLVYPHSSPEKWSRDVEMAATRFFQNDSVTLCTPSEDLYSALRNELNGFTPTTGFVAIATFLSLPLRRLGVFGISFFSTGYTPQYSPSLCAKESPLDWARATGLHDPEAEATLSAKKLAVHRERVDSFPVILGTSIRDRLNREGLEW